MSRKGCAFAVASVFCGSGFLFYALCAGFDESRWFRRYSLDYFLLVHSDSIKAFPVPENENVLDLWYVTSCGDGSKPPSISVVVFVASLDLGYRRAIEGFLRERGLVRTGGEAPLNGWTELRDGAGEVFFLSFHTDFDHKKGPQKREKIEFIHDNA